MTEKFDGTLLLVGAGKMGSALLDGFLRHGVSPDQVVVQDPSPTDDVKHRLEKRGVTLADDAAKNLKEPPSLVLLAVKPQLLEGILPGLASCIGPSTLTISVAAGQPLSVLADGLGASQAIIRAMPNTPASIGQGMTVCVANANVTNVQREHVTRLLSGVGAVAWIDDEAQMDAVTAVSGSGPAYVFLLAEALVEAGVAAGLAPDLAQQLARATVSGAGQLLGQSEHTPGALRHQVTSPGGTTAAALEVLMDEDALTDLLTRAVAAARKRSQDLAG